MIRKTCILNNGDVSMEYYGDDYRSHYILPGERFKHQKVLLDLLSQYGGACTEDPKMYATANEMSCDFNCQQCPKSIYHQIELREKFFINRCHEACLRRPMEDDEWEVSIHTETDHPHFEDFFFRAVHSIPDKPIIVLSYEIMMRIRPEFLHIAKYCYVKIRVRGTEKALDVSNIANKMYHDMDAGIWP